MSVSWIKSVWLSRSVVLILSGTILISIYLFLINSPAVLFKYKDAAAVDPQADLLIVFNPLRDRAPEDKAEKFLEFLAAGACDEFCASLTIDCRRENDVASYGLRSWTVIDREDGDRRVHLHYRVNRAGRREHHSNLWLTLQKVSKHWKVIDYEAWY